MFEATVSVAGIIGFVGLVVPHAIRWLVGPLHHRLLPAVFLAGWIALIALPAPPQPVEYTMAGQTDTLTTVTGYFWFVMLLVSAGPVGLSLAMLISVLRARPAAD